MNNLILFVRALFFKYFDDKIMRRFQSYSSHYVFIKDFNTCIYDHALHSARKHFCRYCLQSLHAAEFLLTFTYLGEDAVYNFINGTIKESKYCRDVMKKH